MAMIYLSVAILGDIVATLALNEARGLTRLAPILICVAGYAVSVTFLSLTLQTIPIQLAYAIWSCSGIVVLATVRWVWFEQPLSWQGILGITFIVGGIFMLKVSVDPQSS
jgi:multidrug transporter EmrE-like cation transporter